MKSLVKSFKFVNADHSIKIDARDHITDRVYFCIYDMIYGKVANWNVCFIWEEVNETS